MGASENETPYSSTHTRRQKSFLIRTNSKKKKKKMCIIWNNSRAQKSHPKKPHKPCFKPTQSGKGLLLVNANALNLAIER